MIVEFAKYDKWKIGDFIMVSIIPMYQHDLDLDKRFIEYKSSFRAPAKIEDISNYVEFKFGVCAWIFNGEKEIEYLLNLEGHEIMRHMTTKEKENLLLKIEAEKYNL